MDDSLNVNKAAGAPSELNVGLGIPTREQLIWALCEVMDGMSWYDLKADTGLSQGECEKLLEIHNSVHQQWVNSGMKMPNVESELNAGLGVSPIKSAHSLILNRLHQMQMAPYYATAREELAMAEATILQLEREASNAWKAALEDAADEIVKLRDALKSYAACGDGCTCGDGWSHDTANAALTPNDGA